MPHRHAAALALTALTLAAGCGGGAAPLDAGDARDAMGDTRSDQAPDRTSDLASDLGNDLGGDLGDAPPDGVDADAAEARADALADVSADRIEVGWPNLCGTSRGTLQLGAAALSTVLGATGANPAVSCDGGRATAGPDAAYRLDLNETTAVDLIVDSEVAVAIAVRTGCAEGVSELACNGVSTIVDTSSSDGGADAPPPAGGDSSPDKWRTTLRTRLPAGKYTVIVDTVGLAEPSSTISISARAVAPQANATCAAPLLLSAGGIARAQELSLGGDPTNACGGRPSTTLYYSVGVPSGQRLTARATITGGDRTWIPLIDASAACGNGAACLAQGHSAGGTMQVLDWLNNGPAWRLVVLAVSSDGPVSGARFDLSISLADQLATCSRPTPVKDGTTLIAQDVQRAPLGDIPSCDGTRTRTLYYSATLLPRQELTATAASTNGGASLGVRASCEPVECVGGGGVVSFRNESADTVTVLIEARPAFPTSNGVFDLLIAMPPPPAGVSVVAPFGLTTTEKGGTAKATLVLRSPPTAPVTIALASGTPAEGTVAPASLQFDQTNWDVPQEVTITGVDDQAADGARRYTIVTSAAMSTDARYDGLEVDDFEVTNQDDDPGLTLEGANLVTTEGGKAVTFKVRLNRQPTAAVRVPLSSSDVSEASVSPAELVFSETTWNVAQEVTVTGVDDAIRDGAQPYSIIVGALVSADAAYGGQNPPDVPGLNRDDDQVTVATKILSGDRSCSAPYGRPIATDQAGNIYAIMTCEGDLVLTTSTDGGATFTEPTVIATASNVGEAAIAGGPAGVAYLAYQGADGLVLRRTADGGVTWSAGQSLLNQAGNLKLVTAQDTVMVAATATETGNNSFLWRSFNGGRSLAARSSLDRVGIEVFLRPDGRTVFLVEPGPDTTRVRQSTNGGETFTVVGTFVTPFGGGFWDMTSTSVVYAIGDSITSFPLTNLSDSDGFGNFISNALAIAVDDRDLVTTIDIDGQTSRLRASRFDFQASPLSDTQAKLIGPHADGASAVALSPRAVATMFWSGSLVLFAVTTWQ
jgi:hypothetical protein